MNPFRKLYCRAFQLCFRIALPIMPYRNPDILDHLSDIPNVLSNHNISSVLLVIDGGVRRLGLTGEFEALLKERGFHFSVYEQNTPNPTIDDIETAVVCYKDVQAQAIIAIGGGSAMDCAKIAGARIAKPKQPVQRMEGILRILKKTPLMIAVPTTAGTGSEVTLAAVITDAKTHHKYPINDFSLIPNYAVLDPNLTVGLPPFITATTGLDALTHAVEAYIGRSTNRLTRSMSVDAVTRVRRSLNEAVTNGSNLEARKDMLQAAYSAGVSFTRSYVGYVHGVAHSLGGQYGIAHGLANAVLLPKYLRLYGDSVTRKLARLAKQCEIAPADATEEAAAEQFIQWIESMNDAFQLPKTFSEIKKEDIPQMSANADRESNPLYPVPRLMNRAELEQAYYLLMEEK